MDGENCFYLHSSWKDGGKVLKYFLHYFLRMGTQNKVNKIIFDPTVVTFTLAKV